MPATIVPKSAGIVDHVLLSIHDALRLTGRLVNPYYILAAAAVADYALLVYDAGQLTGFCFLALVRKRLPRWLQDNWAGDSRLTTPRSSTLKQRQGTHVPCAYLLLIAAAPGLGKALMLEAEQLAARQGIQFSFLKAMTPLNTTVYAASGYHEGTDRVLGKSIETKNMLKRLPDAAAVPAVPALPKTLTELAFYRAESRAITQATKKFRGLLEIEAAACTELRAYAEGRSNKEPVELHELTEYAQRRIECARRLLKAMRRCTPR